MILMACNSNLSTCVKRRCATERIQLRHGVDKNQVLNCRPNSQPSGSKSSHTIKDIENVDVPSSRKETSNNTLDARVGPRNLSSDWVEAVLSSGSISQDHATDV